MTAINQFDGAVPLSQWGVLCAEGADAASFLHGQLTQDVLGLAPGTARLAAYCSSKGRMLASFVVWRTEPERVWLACHRSVLDATLKRLSMFVMRAKCRLHDASAAQPIVGLAGVTADDALAGADVWCVRTAADGAATIRLPDAAGVRRAWVVGGTSPSFDTTPDTSATPATLSAADWAWLDVESGIATIEAATADRFVPQMLNYEQVDGVNFRKGCYPGQEVVARSQYRGTAKRRAFLFDADAEAAPGDDVYASGDPGQPAGTVVNAAPRRGGSATTSVSVLAEVKLAALDTGSLHLRTPDGPRLDRRPLPYDLALT